MEFYYDAEFDAIHRYDGCIQCLVSIGMIAVNDGEIIDQYYSLIQPKRFRKLTRIVREMTQLNNEELRKAPSFREVMTQVECFMDQLCPKQERILYAFGPDDKRTIHSHANYERCEPITMFDDTIDLQSIISKQVLYEGTVVSKTLSLDDLKYAFDVEGEVIHNALNDALDLMRIHQASRNQACNMTHVKEIWERKEKKKEEVRIKAYERMMRMLHERYDKYNEQMKQVEWYPDVIEQLIFLSDQGSLDGWHFDEHLIQIKEWKIPYEQARLYIRWHMKEEPFIQLRLVSEQKEICLDVTLAYRNAGIFNDIWNIGNGSAHERHMENLRNYHKH